MIYEVILQIWSQSVNVSRGKGQGNTSQLYKGTCLGVSCHPNNMRNLEYLYSAVMWRHGWEEKFPRSSSLFKHVWDFLAKMCLQSGEWLERSRAEMQMMAKEEGNCGIRCGCTGTFTKTVCEDSGKHSKCFLLTITLQYHWKLQWLPQFRCLSEFFPSDLLSFWISLAVQSRGWIWSCSALKKLRRGSPERKLHWQLIHPC